MDSFTDSTSLFQFYQCKYGRVHLLAVDNYSNWSTSLTNFLNADRTWKLSRGLKFLLLHLYLKPVLQGLGDAQNHRMKPKL